MQYNAKRQAKTESIVRGVRRFIQNDYVEGKKWRRIRSMLLVSTFCLSMLLLKPKLLSLPKLATFNNKLSKSWVLWNLIHNIWNLVRESTLYFISTLSETLLHILSHLFKIINCVKSVNRSFYGSVIIGPAILDEHSFSLKHKFSSQ